MPCKHFPFGCESGAFALLSLLLMLFTQNTFLCVCPIFISGRRQRQNIDDIDFMQFSLITIQPTTCSYYVYLHFTKLAQIHSIIMVIEGKNKIATKKMNVGIKFIQRILFEVSSPCASTKLDFFSF